MVSQIDRLKRNIEYFKSIACYDYKAHLMIKRIEKKLEELEDLEDLEKEDKG